MYKSFSRLAVSAFAVLSLLLVGGSRQLATPSAHAANFMNNPAPYQSFRQHISPAALLGLGRQQQQSGASPQTEGNGNSLVALMHPHKPTGIPSAPVQSGDSPGPQGGIDTPPPGSIVFNNDPSATEQNETSVTVRQTAAVPTNSARTDTVVGGVNDFRGFYYVPSIGCTTAAGSYCYPARNCVSLSGFSVSFDGGHTLSKNGCLPWVNATYQPFGDPSVDRDAGGNVYYGSLGFDQTTGSGGNGVILERSTSALWNPSEPCQNEAGAGTDNANPCWTGRVVSLGDSNPNPKNGKCDPTFCTFVDKDWVTVDRYSSTQYQGDVYVDWNSFIVAGPNSGTSQVLMSRCHPDNSSLTGFSSCTAPVVISSHADQFTGGAYLTVTRDGYILAGYVNAGTATTLYPLDFRIAVIAPGGQKVLGHINVAHLTQGGDKSSTPCLPNTDPPSSFEYGAPCKDNMGLGGLAGVTMRVSQFANIDVDRSTGTSENNVYTTFELCTLPQYYPFTDGNGNIVYPGNCPKTDVEVARTHISFAHGKFTNTPVQYSDITSSSPGQQFFPTVSVDEQTGAVLETYNSTQDDPFQNTDSIRVQISTNAGSSFAPLGSSTSSTITPVPYQITKDPAGYFGQDSPPCGVDAAATGCPGYAPENGDYLQGLAYFDRLYVHYTGTYVQKGFSPDPSVDALTFFDGTLPMNQDDNFLNRSTYP